MTLNKTLAIELFYGIAAFIIFLWLELWLGKKINQELEVYELEKDLTTIKEHDHSKKASDNDPL